MSGLTNSSPDDPQECLCRVERLIPFKVRMEAPSLGSTEPASSGGSDDFNYISDDEMFGETCPYICEQDTLGSVHDTEYPLFVAPSPLPLSRIPREESVVRYRIVKLSSIGPLSLGLVSGDNKDAICRADSKPWRAKGSFFKLHAYGNFLGEVRSNCIGSKYLFQEEGGSCPLLRIEYESRITSSKEDLGPCRRFCATILPRTSDIVGHNIANSTACEAFDIFSECIMTPLRLSSLEPIKTINGYVLDFNSSKSVVPSVKNFAMVNLVGTRVLSMYKTQKDEFELVIQGGFLSPLHAFAIAISSIDKKLCTQ
jgi:hypothetical protein